MRHDARLHDVSHYSSLECTQNCKSLDKVELGTQRGGSIWKPHVRYHMKCTSRRRLRSQVILAHTTTSNKIRLKKIDLEILGYCCGKTAPNTLKLDWNHRLKTDSVNIWSVGPGKLGPNWAMQEIRQSTPAGNIQASVDSSSGVLREKETEPLEMS